jgi:ribonuclease E
MAKKQMLINVLQAEESRVAIVEDGVLEWIEIETGSQEKLKGNIYKGVVENLNPSLQAAFVKLSIGRSGFLPMDEINFRTVPATRRSGAGKGKGTRSARGRGMPRIGDLLEAGQELLVQVSREPFGRKPPSLTTFFSLPGRYLVLLPGSESSGISRKIENEAGRERLKKIVRGLKVPEGVGLIVRTAGLDRTKAEINRDMRYLTRLWQQIDRVAEKAKAPSLIYQERDLVLRAIRDLYTPDIEEVVLDNEEVHKRAVRYFRNIMPGKQKLIRLYAGDEPLFSQHGLEDQIETIYKRRVPLPSGGAIVVDETEALTSIDVNSGKTREGSIEETAYKANLEAAGEIARQLRLRDIAGLIVIDFIDMRSRSSIRAVEKRLREAMRQDKARHDMTRISKLGLLEMSRQRLRATTASATYETCMDCEGSGVVKTVESAALALLRRIHARAVRGDLARIRLLLPSDVANYLLNRKREDLLRLEQRSQTEILISSRPDLRTQDVQFEVEARETAAKEGQSRREMEPQVKHPEMEETGAEGRVDEKRRRRVRRPRRGNDRREAEADAPAADPLPKGGGERDGAADVESEEGPKKTVRRRRARGGRARRSRAGGRRKGDADPEAEIPVVRDEPLLSGPPDVVSGPDEDRGDEAPPSALTPYAD